MIKKTLDSELELEDIKIKFASRKKKASIILGIISLATFVGYVIAQEYLSTQNRIILATTTSTYDSGLLEYLIPEFESKFDITVDIISVGTGQALETGEKGDADVVLVHSRSQEDVFVDNDYGIHRTCVMYNDFIIVGPSSDPANINKVNISGAMIKLKNSGESGQIKFYSRGDNSGTHSKELKLWSEIGFSPDADEDNLWYFETGSGMSTTLTIANENDGYTLTDRGTWLSSKENLDLDVLVSGEKILLNPYGAMAINPKLHPSDKYDYAITFIGFLVSEEGQELIGDYRKNGEILFTPCFGKCDETHDCSTTEEEIDFWSDHNDGYKGTASQSSYSSINYFKICTTYEITTQEFLVR